MIAAQGFFWSHTRKLLLNYHTFSDVSVLADSLDEPQQHQQSKNGKISKFRDYTITTVACDITYRCKRYRMYNAKIQVKTLHKWHKLHNYKVKP